MNPTMPSMTSRRLRAVGRVACEWFCFAVALSAIIGLTYFIKFVPGMLIEHNITTKETLNLAENIIAGVMLIAIFGGALCGVCVLKFREHVIEEESRI